MFEVVLSTMESKLRRVENLDRAVQHLMRKMDSIEEKIETKSVDILNKIDNLGQTLNSKISMMPVTSQESSIENINSRLDQMSLKLDVITTNNNNSQDKIKRHIINPTNDYDANQNKKSIETKDIEELFVAQPSDRKSR